MGERDEYMNEVITEKDELRPEYDLSTLLDGGVRGKYAAQYQEGTNLVLLVPDVQDVLADEARWDDQFAATQDGLKKMADKVRADIQAERTMPMVFTKDGEIAPE